MFNEKGDFSEMVEEEEEEEKEIGKYGEKQNITTSNESIYENEE